jgi:hypothetical protein
MVQFAKELQKMADWQKLITISIRQFINDEIVTDVNI